MGAAATRFLDARALRILAFGLLSFGLVTGCQSVTPGTPANPTGVIANQPNGAQGPVALPEATIVIGAGAKPGAGPETPIRTAEAQTTGGEFGLVPANLAGRPFSRAAILLPLNSANAAFREEAHNLLAAAELALFEVKDKSLALLPIDSGESEASAQRAAQEAVAKGADVIIGPLLSAEVRGAASAAAGRPIIAFSTDSTVAGPDSYLLSALPSLEARRVVAYAAQQGVTSLYIFAPDNEFGRRAAEAAQAEAALRGMAVPAAQFYPRSADLRNFKLVEAPARALALAMKRNPAGPGKRAIFIPDRGDALRATMPLIAGNGVDPRAIRILGLGAWLDTDLTHESTFYGAWFAATDPATRQGFVADFQAAFGHAPSRISSFAYDATALVSALNRANGGPGFTAAAIRHDQGFLGVDGLFRFGADGRIERGLAILEVTAQGPILREAAPKVFDPSAS